MSNSTKQTGLQPIRNALTLLGAAFAHDDEMTQICIIIPLPSGGVSNRGIKIWQHNVHIYVAPYAHGSTVTVGNYLAAGTRVKSVPQLNTALRAIRELICGIDPAARMYASERSSNERSSSERSSSERSSNERTNARDSDRTTSNKYKIPRFGIIQPPLTNIRDTPTIQPPPGLALPAKK